jgi:hypothetical protein
MPATATTVDSLTLTVSQEIHVRAPIDATFAAILAEVGPGNQTPDGRPLAMTIEPWPGGRWYRDLGADNGHFWGHVQAIKRPTLLEISGPLFMSSAVLSNIQYRLREVPGGTLITFRHIAFGFVPDEFRADLGSGWKALGDRIRQRAEQTATQVQ